MPRMHRSGRALTTTLKEWGGSSSVHGVSYVCDRDVARVDRGVWGILVSLLLCCFFKESIGVTQLVHHNRFVQDIVENFLF